MPACQSGEKCEKVWLLRGNIDAWEIYCRVYDQIGMYPNQKNEQHIYLRAEAVTAMISLVDPEDPLETFERVMTLHKVKYRIAE